MVNVQRLNMIQIDNVIEKIIKKRIIEKSEKNMNKNTLFNKMNENFQKEIDDNNILALEDEIMNVCSADNICSFSDFEKIDFEYLKDLKSKIENNLKSCDKLIIEDFVSKDIVMKFKLKISELLKKIELTDYKLFYLKKKKQISLKNCKIPLVVECGKLFKEVELEQKKLLEEYHDNVVQLKNIQKDLFEKYTQMINEFCEKEFIDDNISNISNKYSAEVLKVFLIRKVIYIISQNFQKKQLPKVIKTLENSERFKNNFEFVYKEILEDLKNVGTNCKFGN